MQTYRICRSRYAHDLSGRGAEINGGRWNSRGLAMLYSSEHISLALLEIMVHAEADILPLDLQVLCLELPSHTSQTANISALRDKAETRSLGDEFLRNGSFLTLRVPSVVIPEEYNILINPNHPLMEEVNISKQRALNLDERLS